MARPNLTAIKIGRITVFLGDHEIVGPLLPEGAAQLTRELLVERGHLRPWMLRFYEAPGRRAWLERTGDRFSPGQTVRVGLRKRFMDDELRAAIEAGATQVLAIGAGYDTTCLRLAAQYGGCRFFEIDQPGTLEDKRAGIEAIGRARPNLELIASDLAKTPLAEVLAASSWDDAARDRGLGRAHVPARGRGRGLLRRGPRSVWAGLAADLHLHEVRREGPAVGRERGLADAGGPEADGQRLAMVRGR